MEEKGQIVDELITKVFVEQPALHPDILKKSMKIVRTGSVEVATMFPSWFPTPLVVNWPNS